VDLKRISPEETKELLDADDGFVYLDVRDVAEFAAGHPPGAKNVPVFERGPMGMAPNSSFVEVVEANFTKETKIITGCLRGPRSMRAAQMLIAAGFSEVIDMRGGLDGEMDPMGGIGYPGWQRRGLPVSSDPKPEDTYSALKQTSDR